jgi:hypothetical protein
MSSRPAHWRVPWSLACAQCIATTADASVDGAGAHGYFLYFWLISRWLSSPAHEDIAYRGGWRSTCEVLWGLHTLD